MLLKDLKHYTDTGEDDTTSMSDNIGPFDKFSDRQPIDEYLQSITEETIDTYEKTHSIHSFKNYSCSMLLLLIK